MAEHAAVPWVPLILLMTIVNTAAQITLKRGATCISGRDLSWPNAFSIGRDAAQSGYIWLGLAMYGLSSVMWIVILSRVDLSAAYPFVSLAFVLTSAYGYAVLGEPIGAWRAAGVGLIVVGVVCLSRS